MELIRALEEALWQGVDALDGGLSLDAALVDLHRALARAGDIMGIAVGDAVLDRIFSTFCLGK